MPDDENQPPVPLTQRDLGVGDLAAVGLAAQLLDRLDEQEHAAHAGVAGRQPAAVGVGRQRAADAQLAVLDERRRPRPCSQKPSASSVSSTIDVNAS